MADDTYVIDAAGLLVGRFATHAARAAMHGKQVRIVNCEKAALSGQKHMLIALWKRKYARGVPRKGPFIVRQPDRFVRRIIRGMLPNKTARGREAYANLLCYIGTPKEFEGKAVAIEGAAAAKMPARRYLTVGQLCKELGGTWYE